MATMSMDIGGAETHILEISKELSHRGYSVTLVSNGGVYVKELEEAGVRHVHAPLNRRKLTSIMKAYFIIKKEIKAQKPDIVHAHARIPGFVCGLIRKRIPFEFVTTDHGVYETSGLQGKLSNWGQKTMAVSEDIRRYLIENYDINESNIYMTINGIDTDKFSPETNGGKVIKELKLGSRVLVHVSRLDSGASMIASQLIESGERLAGEIDDLSIVIAGDGNMYGKLCEKADEANRRIGRKCIIMTGSRTDISNIIAAGTIFIGVSRAVLEAMSGGKPVIVAGDMGYIGVFTEKCFDTAWSTNFCCRGCESSDTEKLFGDIAALFRLAPDERQDMGAYCRETILRYYSVAKMADDYEKMYAAPLKAPCKVLISGYYGYKNAGDDAILHSIKQSLCKLDVPPDISVLSHNRHENSKIMGLRPVYRFNMLYLIKAIYGSDLLISGGGSLLQDKTSTRSLLYYLSVINIAKFLGKKIIIYANGIGPVNKEKNRRRMKRAVQKADIITLRESSSLTELLEMGVVHPEIHVAADPVFLLESSRGKDGEAERRLREIGITGKKPVLGVSVRDLNTDGRFRKNMARLLDNAYERMGMDVLFIIMQSPNDVGISKEIRNLMTVPSFIMGENMTPEEIMGITGHMSFVISMRLHTIIFSVKEHVPVIGIECDPKISYYQDILKMPTLGTPADFDSRTAGKLLEEMADNLEKYREDIKKSAAEMETSAKENEFYLKKAIELCMVER